MTAHFIAEQLRRVRGGFIAKGGQLPGSSAQAALKPPCGDARQTGGGQRNVGIHRVAAAFPISGAQVGVQRDSDHIHRSFPPSGDPEIVNFCNVIQRFQLVILVGAECTQRTGKVRVAV